MKKKELKARITELEAELALVKRQRDILVRDEDEDQVEIAAMRAEYLLLSGLYEQMLSGAYDGLRAEFSVPVRGGRTRVSVNGRFIS